MSRNEDGRKSRKNRGKGNDASGTGGGRAARSGAEVRFGVRRASAFLARRSLRAHRRAWGAVFAATAAASALIGAFALVVGSLLLAQPPVERYAAADAVVTADQEVTYTAKPWGSKPKTTSTYLPERVRLDRALVAKAAAARGVAKAVADDAVPLTVGGRGGAAPGLGRSWAAAALTPYRLTDGHAPGSASEVVLDGALAAATGSGTGGRVTLQVDGAPRTYTVSGVAERGHRDGSPAVFLTERHLTALAGHPGTVDAVGVIAGRGSPPTRCGRPWRRRCPTGPMATARSGCSPARSAGRPSTRTRSAPAVSCCRCSPPSRGPSSWWRSW